MILNKFDNKEVLEQQLSNEIVRIIQEEIENKGFANVLLSGGSTPLKLYEELGESHLDWAKVNIGLVDERFVPPSSEFNNHVKIEKALNKKSNQQITVSPLVIDETNFEKNLAFVRKLYLPFIKEIDICLLGMGEDGHTASIFPDDPQSEILISNEDKDLGPANAPTFPYQRISCNKSMLRNSKHIALMIVGVNKIKKLQTAIDSRLPIAEFSNPDNELNVYFSA